MTSDNGTHQPHNPPPHVSEEEMNEDMETPPIPKPTVEYQGYKRTITDVVRIRKSEQQEDAAGVSQLMEGIDDAIKTCRNLRHRLERLHKKRNTGYYQKLVKSSRSPNRQ